MKKFLLTAALASCFFSANLQAALSVNLAYLALTNQTMPAMQGDQFTSFATPHINAGNIVFYGMGALGSFGIFTNAAGYLSNLISSTTTVPQGIGNFSSFDNFADFTQSPLSYNQYILGNTVAFTGTDNSWQTGIYSYTNGNIKMIANEQTAIPNSINTFTTFAYPTVLPNGNIAFWGNGKNGSEGIYVGNAQGNITKLVDNTTLIPGSVMTFQHFRYPSFSHTANQPLNFAFVGENSNHQRGIYLMQNGKIRTIADTNTSIPGSGIGYFTDFHDISYDSTTGKIAFIATGILGQIGLYIYNGAQIQVVATPQNLLPNAVGQFATFSMPNLMGNNLVFQATGSYQTEGIYLYTLDGNMFKIISNRDSINGNPINNVQISHESFSGNQVVVLINFTNGNSGIYIATMQGVAY